MNPALASLVVGLDKRPGAALAAIRGREQELGFKFPDDYVEFMLASNGGEGLIGETYLRIDPIEEMMSDHLQVAVTEFRPGLIVFGSDGGGEAFAFDTRGDDPRVVMCPWVGIDEEEVIGQGRTFTEFLERARADALFEAR